MISTCSPAEAEEIRVTLEASHFFSFPTATSSPIHSLATARPPRSTPALNAWPGLPIADATYGRNRSLGRPKYVPAWPRSSLPMAFVAPQLEEERMKTEHRKPPAPARLDPFA